MPTLFRRMHLAPPLLLAALALCGLPSNAGSSVEPGAAPGYSTELSLSRVEEPRGAYFAHIDVRDLRTNLVVAAPSLLAPSGETAEAETQLEGSASTLLFRVKVADQRAFATVVLREGALATVLHTSTVNLAVP